MSIGEGTRLGHESGERLTREPISQASANDALTSGRGTRAVLDSLPPRWQLVHDRHWPGRSYDTIDHIAVGPTGIFIIDSVGWSGAVEMTEDVLEVNGRSRLAAVQSCLDNAREVALLLPPHLRDHCFPVICLAREESVSGWVKGVRVCSTLTIGDLLQKREAVFCEAEVLSVGAEMEAALPSSQATAIERTRLSDLTVADPTAAPVLVEPGALSRLQSATLRIAALVLMVAAATVLASLALRG